MLTLAPYIIIFLATLLFVGQYCRRTFRIPRDTLLCLGGLLTTSYWLMSGASVIFIPMYVFYLITLMLLWWFICEIISSHPHLALNDFITFTSVLLLCLFVSPNFLFFGLKLLVISTLLNGIYAHLQTYYRYDFWKKSSNLVDNAAIGFIGNPNYLGNWLVPGIFSTAWLGVVDSPFWFLSLPFFVYILIRTFCRSAMFGLFVGALFVSFGISTLSGFILIGLLFFAIAYISYANPYGLRTVLLRPQTLKERKNYWRVALKQIPRTPIFGTGLNLFMTKVPFLQREINNETNKQFLLRKNYTAPMPQRCHNDYLQHILDHGFVGFILLMGLFVISLSYMTKETLFLGGGLVALLASGMFFHGFHVRVIQVYFWLIALSIIKLGSGTVGAIALPGSLPIILVIIYFIFFIRYTVGTLLYDIVFERFLLTNNIPKFSLWFHPHGSAINNFLTLYWLRNGHLWKAWLHATKAVHNYDGEQTMWGLWYNIGAVNLLSGSFQLAVNCFDEALSFLPEYEDAIKSRDDALHILQNPTDAPKQFVINNKV